MLLSIWGWTDWAAWVSHRLLFPHAPLWLVRACSSFQLSYSSGDPRAGCRVSGSSLCARPQRELSVCFPVRILYFPATEFHWSLYSLSWVLGCLGSLWNGSFLGLFPDTVSMAVLIYPRGLWYSQTGTGKPAGSYFLKQFILLLVNVLYSSSATLFLIPVSSAHSIRSEFLFLLVVDINA